MNAVGDDDGDVVGLAVMNHRIKKTPPPKKTCAHRFYCQVRAQPHHVRLDHAVLTTHGTKEK